jgi:hypothetical protein
MKRRLFLRQTTLGTVAYTTFNKLLANERAPDKQKNPHGYNSVYRENTLRIAIDQQEGNPGAMKLIEEKPWILRKTL